MTDTSTKTLYDYVIKVTHYTLNLVTSADDPLLSQLSGFIYNNLGIDVDTNGRKYQVLDSIEDLYTKRREKINAYGLDKLELMLRALDRNNSSNIQAIVDYIKDNHNISIKEYELYPSIDYHYIIDNLIEKYSLI